MTFKPWMFPLAVGLAMLLLAVPLAAANLALIPIFFSVIPLTIAGVMAYKGRRDKYDLNYLRDLHEREEAAAIELEEPQEYDSFMCMGCGEVYSTKLSTCPRCKKGCGG